MKTLCVTGYASIDYVMNLDSALSSDQTSIGQRVDAAWPRLGGCPAYIALAAKKLARDVVPVTWIGDDAHGQKFISNLTQRNIDTRGVCVVRDARSPSAVLLYQPDGSCACVYDPALAGQERLSADQRATIAGATHICLSVGPPQLSNEIIALANPDARFYWAVKKDTTCFNPDICRILSARADVIFCSASERDMLDATSAVVVQTLGSKGVLIETGGSTLTVPVDALTVRDTTGAGDSFAGGYIAAEMSGICEPDVAVGSAINTVQHFLRNRDMI